MIGFRKTDWGFERTVPPNDYLTFKLLERNLNAAGVNAKISGDVIDGGYVVYLRVYADENTCYAALDHLSQVTYALLERGWHEYGDKYISAVDMETARKLAQHGVVAREGYTENVAIVEFSGSALELNSIFSDLEYSR